MPELSSVWPSRAKKSPNMAPDAERETDQPRIQPARRRDPTG
jgi:hypothetical protein